MKTYEEFTAALKNGKLKNEMEDFAKTVKDKAEHEKDVLFCEFAKKLDYDVSVEDLAAQKASAQNINDDELEAVAGGSSECGNISSYMNDQFTTGNCQSVSFCSAAATEIGIG